MARKRRSTAKRPNSVDRSGRSTKSFKCVQGSWPDVHNYPTDDLELVATCRNGEEALTRLREDPPDVAVLDLRGGRTSFTLDDEYVVRRDGEKLGEQGGDFTPFVIDLDGAPSVPIAGIPLDNRTRYVYVNDHPVRVNSTCAPPMWMAPPLPFYAGMTLTVTGKAEPESEELWRLESGPLSDGENEPVLGPGWTRYAPLPPPSTS